MDSNKDQQSYRRVKLGKLGKLGKGEYWAQQIVDHRIDKGDGQLRFRVQWETEIIEKTWEPCLHVVSASDVLIEYAERMNFDWEEHAELSDVQNSAILMVWIDREESSPEASVKLLGDACDPRVRQLRNLNDFASRDERKYVYRYLEWWEHRSDATRAKDDPEQLAEAAEHLGISAARICRIEDYLPTLLDGLQTVTDNWTKLFQKSTIGMLDAARLRSTLWFDLPWEQLGKGLILLRALWLNSDRYMRSAYHLQLDGDAVPQFWRVTFFLRELAREMNWGPSFQNEDFLEELCRTAYCVLPETAIVICMPFADVWPSHGWTLAKARVAWDEDVASESVRTVGYLTGTAPVESERDAREWKAAHARADSRLLPIRRPFAGKRDSLARAITSHLSSVEFRSLAFQGVFWTIPVGSDSQRPAYPEWDVDPVISNWFMSYSI